MDLNTEKKERLKLCTTICQLENELTQLRRQVTEPSSSSLPVPFTVDPPSSAAFQDSSALGSIQISRPRVTITLKRTSSTTSRSQLTEQPRAPPLTQTTFGPSSDLETRVRQLKEEITNLRDSRETTASIYRSQFAFLYDRIPALEKRRHRHYLVEINFNEIGLRLRQMFCATGQCCQRPQYSL